MASYGVFSVGDGKQTACFITNSWRDISIKAFQITEDSTDCSGLQQQQQQQ